MAYSDFVPLSIGESVHQLRARTDGPPLAPLLHRSFVLSPNPAGIGRGQVSTQLCPALAPLCPLVYQSRILISSSSRIRSRALMCPRADNSCNATFAQSPTWICAKLSAS